MRSAFFLFLSFVGLLLHGQESTLAIKGSASASVKPTVTVIDMNIESTKDSYSDAIEDMINRIDHLTAEMKKIGFKEEEVITSNFNINKHFNYNQGRNEKEVFNARQTLSVQFKQSKDRLLEVINTATSSEAQPEVSISFQLAVDHKKELRDELIKLAIRDANATARLITDEAQYVIKSISNITYGPSFRYERPFLGGASSEMMDLKMSGIELTNMEVANLTFTESVEITFLIEEK